MQTMDPALGIKANPQRDGYGDNPRCLRRDVNTYFTTQFLRNTDLVDHITSNSAIGKFQDSLQNDANNKVAIHTSGHFTIWGDPGGDVYVSPAEPGFWLHHGQLDRHWWMWANYLEAEVSTRASQYEGEFDFYMFLACEQGTDTVTGGTNWMNPSSARGQPTDPQWLSVTAPDGTDGIASNQLFSTTAGPFCYLYK